MSISRRRASAKEGRTCSCADTLSRSLYEKHLPAAVSALRESVALLGNDEGSLCTF